MVAATRDVAVAVAVVRTIRRRRRRIDAAATATSITGMGTTIGAATIVMRAVDIVIVNTGRMRMVEQMPEMEAMFNVTAHTQHTHTHPHAYTGTDHSHRNTFDGNVN